MWFKTDTTVVHLNQILIVALVEKKHLISVSYYTYRLSSEDTKNMLNVTMPEQIRICGS
jgi:hypothetical protein